MHVRRAGAWLRLTSVSLLFSRRSQVKVWFQNRRMKWRHSKEAQAQKDKDKEAGEKPSGGAVAADGEPEERSPSPPSAAPPKAPSPPRRRWVASRLDKVGGDARPRRRLAALQCGMDFVPAFRWQQGQGRRREGRALMEGTHRCPRPAAHPSRSRGESSAPSTGLPAPSAHLGLDTSSSHCEALD